MTEFDEAFGEQIDSYEPGADGVVDLTELDYEGVPRSKVDEEIRKARKVDKKLASMSYMFGGVGWLGGEACDSKAAERMFFSRDTKPRWAVEALELLRDQGSCRVCGDQIKRGWIIGQLIPQHSGGLYSVSNCVLMCKNCGECWSGLYKTFDIGDSVEKMWGRIQEFVLKRRLGCFRNCKGLNSEQVEYYKKLRSKNYKPKSPVLRKLIQTGRV